MAEQQVFGDRYELVRHVARGGMAQVYLARDLLLDRPVALKVLFPELSVDRSFVERFRQEARAAANLTHPNIVSVYDWGQGEHTYFIVMEYVDGDTLSALVRRQPLPPVRAAEIGASVAAALEFAHNHGVIHRDVKPGNVLIDTSGQVKVTDFGIARAVGAKEGLTQAGSVMGTATYFSPEQAQGLPVDARSDVYSLGVVLFEMVIGQAPFSGDNPVAIAYKHVREQPPAPTGINPAISTDYEAIILKAMAKSPDDRYPTAEALRADLLRFQRGEPVEARPAALTSVVPAAVGPVTTVLSRPPVPPGGPPAGPGRAGAPPPGDPERSRRAVFVTLVAVLVIILAVLVFFLGRELGVWDATKTLTVPSGLVGQSESAATAQLHQEGFSNIQQRTSRSQSVQSGNVIRVTPPAGTKRKSNAAVTLLVSTGPVMIDVPNVANQTQAQAVAALQAAHFKTTVQQQNSTTVTVGSVISTSPAGGQSAAEGSTVTVYVSSGLAQVNVPSVAGESPAAAGSKLGALNLQVQSASESSTTYAVGEVAGTSPVAGTSVPVGSTVIVYVSTGPPQTTVPDLSGDTQAHASAALQSAQLTPNFVNQTVNDPAENGVVISQSPAASSSVAQGSTVTVTIGQYAGGSSTTSTSSTTTGTGGST